jgi:hypothetical protein
LVIDSSFFTASAAFCSSAISVSDLCSYCSFSAWSISCSPSNRNSSLPHWQTTYFS